MKRDHSPFLPNEVPAHVLAVVTHVAMRMRGAKDEDKHCRYDLGTVAHCLRVGPEFPSRTLSALAHKAGVKVATLRRLARVAEAIPWAEFETYITLSLTWSHIEELAEVHDASQRRLYAREAERRGLSVAQLRKLIRR